MKVWLILPPITGIQPKRAKREPLGEALVEAVSTIVGGLRTPEIKQWTTKVVITSDTTADFNPIEEAFSKLKALIKVYEMELEIEHLDLEDIVLQWNPSIADTMGLLLSVRIIEASVFQRLPVYFR